MERRFNNLEEAGKYMKEKQKDFIKQGEDLQPVDASPESCRIYLYRGIACMPEGMHKDFLKLRVHGVSRELMTEKLKVPMSDVLRIEKEALEVAKNSIDKDNKRGHSEGIWTPPGI